MRAPKASRIVGSLGAMGFAAWLGIPLLGAIVAGQVENHTTRLVEAVITGLLVGIALFTAWRYHKLRGWIVGPVLLVALIVELVKRFAMQGPAAFGVVDTTIAVLIFIGLSLGIRAARAMRAGALL